MKKLQVVVFIVILLLGFALAGGRGGVSSAAATSGRLEGRAAGAPPRSPSGDGRFAIVPMDDLEPGEHPELGYLSLVVVAIFFGGAAVFIYRRYR